MSISCQKNPEVGIRRIPAYTPQYTTGYSSTFLTRGSQLHGFCTTLYKHRQLCTLCMNDNITKAHRHACNQPTKHIHTQPCNGLLSGINRVSQYQKKHSPTHAHKEEEDNTETQRQITRSALSQQGLLDPMKPAYNQSRPHGRLK